MKSSRLSRLRDALKARDWLGIGIEIVVVVLGVLIAFQIDQWGARRKQADDERQFLERLYRENAQGAEELRAIIRQYDRLVFEVGTALRAQAYPHRLRPYLAKPNFGCGIGALPAATYNDTTSEELITAGRVSLITDRDLQADLRRLAASQARGVAELMSTSARISDGTAALDPYYRLNVDAENAPVCSIDWIHLLADQRAVNAATRLLRRHVLTRQARMDTLAQSQRVQARLACILAKPECKR